MHVLKGVCLGTYNIFEVIQFLFYFFFSCEFIFWGFWFNLWDGSYCILIYVLILICYYYVEKATVTG